MDIGKTRSWDFMPPDVVRPIASTTLGCLITMAYSLDMNWTDFRLDEGIMRAVGGGRSLSTSIVRGMGLVVEYSTDASKQAVRHRLPSKVADQVRVRHYWFTAIFPHLPNDFVKCKVSLKAKFATCL